MFERYTEKARRVIFFARYEASQFGSPYIETEHLLLGLLREDKTLANRFLRSHAAVDSIRKQIEGHTTVREKVSDFGRSAAEPRVQARSGVWRGRSGAAEPQAHRHGASAARACCGKRSASRRRFCTSADCGFRRSARNWRGPRSEKVTSNRPKESSLLAEFSRDLTQAAMDNSLDPLIGRDYELERVVQILCRRTKNNPVLIGEPGVGKTAIVEGPGAADRRRRRAFVPGGQAHSGAGSFADRRGHQVSRTVRRAAQDHHEGADGESERHHLHR